MASLLSRRRINPRVLLQNFHHNAFKSQSNSLQPPQFFTVSTNPIHHFRKSQLITSQSIQSWLEIPHFHPYPAKSPIFPTPNLFMRHLSSTSPENSDSGNPQVAPKAPEFRHQEIEGPTVKRDLSDLANETRHALDSLCKSIYDVSSSLALLGVTSLAASTTVVYLFQPHGAVAVVGLAAFAFPFSVAFLLRRSLKPMTFFRKMEERGRLQILTLALQVSKNLNILFLRIRVVSIGCVVGIAVGSLVTLWPQ